MRSWARKYIIKAKALYKCKYKDHALGKILSVSEEVPGKKFLKVTVV